jgi:hypothetical protein
MTKLLQDVIARVRQWPDDRQDEAARLLLELDTQRTSRLRLSPEQVEEVARIQRRVADGTAEFATDEQMAAFWRSCGL